MDVEEVTALLREASAGRDGAQDRLASVVYDDLRRLARQVPGTAAEPTGLVHEAWLRLVARGARRFESRAHFYAVAARAMRGLAVDAVRASHRRAEVGDSRLGVVPSTEREQPLELDVLDLDAALDELADVDADLARLVELRFFAGLTVAEAAEALGTSISGAERRWRLARAWLHRHLAGHTGADDEES